jgi:hypothetical protein
VIIDTEIQSWQREWRDQTDPLPDLKKKIKRQNLHLVASVFLLCACLAVSTTEAIRTRNSLIAGFAVGVWFAGLVAGTYAWWVRRGTWKPAAQTTLAYLQLSHQRAVARVRTIRFSFYFLLVATVLYVIPVVWYWKSFSYRAPLILAAMVAELFFFRYLARRKQREIEETKKLVEQARE